MAAGVLSAAIRAANLFVNARLSALIGSDLAVEGYRRTLEQPYAVHLGRNSSEVITRLGYLGAISRGVLPPFLQGLSGLIVAVVLGGAFGLSAQPGPGGCVPGHLWGHGLAESPATAGHQSTLMQQAMSTFV